MPETRTREVSVDENGKRNWNSLQNWSNTINAVKHMRHISQQRTPIAEPGVDSPLPRSSSLSLSLSLS